MNTPVSFELAKLLKEKGFDKICKKYYPDDGSLLISNKGSIRHIVYRIQAPTIAEVVMWLYEKHGIWIHVMKYKDHAADVNDPYEFTWDMGKTTYRSPTEAYEAAIKYCLTKWNQEEISQLP